MIKGRFGNTSGRPYIDGYLEIPHLSVRGNISFVLDTGSDCTVLMPLDANRLRLDYARLVGSPQDESQGFNGRSVDFVVPASLIIREETAFAHGYEIDLRVPEPKDGTDDIPSILGRDILDHWRFTIDRKSSVIEAIVNWSKQRFDL
jgi:hypothetical protein